MSWHLPKYSVYGLCFVFHVNEVQKAVWAEFLGEGGIIGNENFSLSRVEFSMENQVTCRSELPMMDIKHDPEKSD